MLAIISGVIIVFAVLILLFVFIVVTYNNLVVMRNKVRNSFAQIDTQLQRRFDLIPNLVETVQGYASHEKELLENVARTRGGYMNAGSMAERLNANNQLTAALRTLFTVVENYPTLQANASFLQLQQELTNTEQDVAFARQFYNDTVTLYNNKRQMFPSNIVASLFGFKEEELFTSDDDARTAPRVQF